MVLVDIDMPKNCSSCPFLAAIRGAVEYPVCGINEKIALDFYKMDDGRDERCPIKGEADFISKRLVLGEIRKE